MTYRLLAVLIVLFWHGMADSALAQSKYSTPLIHNLKHLPARWGAYTIIQEDHDQATQICVYDWHHSLVREIDSGTCSAVYTQQITPVGIPDLIIVAWDGSNLYGVHTTYIFRQNHGIRNVGIIAGGEGHFRRLGNHGLQFVMERSGVLEWHFSHAYTPNLPVVLDWHMGHTVDATRRYPALCKASAIQYRHKVIQDCAGWKQSRSVDALIALAAGYYANEYELGHGRSAYRWIMHHLPTSNIRERFADSARDVRHQISQIRHMTTVSQAKILTTPDENVFTN